MPLLNNGARALPSTGASRQASEHFSWLSSLASQTHPRFDRCFSAEAPKPEIAHPEPEIIIVEDKDKVVEMDEGLGIATGLELQELLAEKRGKKLFDLDAPRGPFGTKEHPAIIQSRYDERIVGCSGGVGEDEHDVVWFKLKKGELYECTICTQIFQLEVVGPGGPPGGHHDH